MGTHGDLREALALLSKRSIALKNACGNEESTKLYLVLPLIGVLGYDHTDPYEVYPEHAADFDPRQPNKVDFAILRDGQPIVAIECKKVGADLPDARGQLRAYYNALPTTKLAILTNGILFEFFVDSADPNLMDEEPFLVVDLENVTRNGVSDEILQALNHLTKAQFNPDTVAELAHVELVKRRLRTCLVDEAKTPSEDFCRFLLQKAGLKNVRKAAIERHYASIIKTAFVEALVLPVVEQISGGIRLQEGEGMPSVPTRIRTTERELAIVNYVRCRLAFLVSEETLFDAIERIEYRDYIGKLIVFYGKERKGRLFDFIEGNDGFDKFIFPEPHGELVTNNILDIDGPLEAIFTTHVREFGLPRAATRLAQIA
jgi:predicted type IV restriction endonuclease